MEVTAKITGIKYSPQFCKELNNYQFKDLKEALENDSSFIIEFEKNKLLAVSFWVTAKRQCHILIQEYIIHFLFKAKKFTIIPVLKMKVLMVMGFSAMGHNFTNEFAWRLCYNFLLLKSRD
jgi:hypothetical protein